MTRILALQASLVLSASVASALPSKSLAPDLREILALPVQNRIVAAEKQKSNIYPQLKALAFSERGSMDERWKALSLAAHLSPNEGTALAKKALQQDEWYMRNAGLVVLASLKSPDTKDSALKLLADPALVVRSAAVESLAGFSGDHREVRTALWNELFHQRNFRKGQSLWIRKQIVEVLVKDIKPMEAPMLSRLTKDRDEGIRSLVAAVTLPSNSK